MLACSSVQHGGLVARLWHALPALALALPGCGDGVGHPIVGVEGDETPSGDAGLQGGGGDDSGVAADAADVGDSGDDYCAAVAAWPETDANVEAQIVAFLNGVRVVGLDCSGITAGERLNLLTEEEALDCAARVHTRDMIERDYFDHISPDGDGPEDRVARAGYPVGVVGEVIGELDLAASPDGVLNGGSEDCAVLLDPSFDAVGAGYYDGVWTIVLAGPLELSP